ncbi:MAG: tRNA guanosine(34) transglycosylase Tgt [Candidatus Levybacteria bacterium RIFCSPHIGHO2_02_FULL_37_13]|nr:MAG: tRNA guanosine(34) transglycosylase Tgt [Candidatus Levybacteria bacterium RIFCSPHIGHO2_02_FULL_37_13]OGH30710.1 MAG: tRNA guanosine(34) transglycosylase Tgt [Candidatus Levybacteria bacterium RIFCSPHIGHO2_12_FULL_37_9]OGH39372.1 MAG: tRNA guanosine(34) transglycosylase Tgt [Candidatus Levybacteria bacterium RIFCSPLOWO2_01_FULL_37_26]
MTKLQNPKTFSFEVIAKDKKSQARVGRIMTAHGVIETPAFVAVGTRATVRGLTPSDLKEIGVQILFGNTYHLHLRPGEEVVKKFGGLGKFMGWNGPTITDSGGFQVFSLGQASLSSRTSFGISLPLEMLKQVQHDSNEQMRLVKIKDDGVTFRSHLDGSLHEFTPEKSIEIQQKLGADIILVLDECAPHPSTHKYTKEAMERTHRWALRSLEEFRRLFNLSSRAKRGDLPNEIASSFTPRNDNNKQAIYGIIQGGVYKDLRRESAKFISALPFEGIAIGGVSVGESKKQMRDALDWVVPFLPEEKPLHLLGIGQIDDIFDSIEKGMDTFDCVIPTRMGRYGMVFVSPPEGNRKNKFMIDIKKSIFAKDKRPVTKDCNCSVCKTFTRGYVHHLFRVQELLAYRLASYHNLYFINNLFAKIRKSILEGRFERTKKEWL